MEKKIFHFSNYQMETVVISWNCSFRILFYRKCYGNDICINWTKLQKMEKKLGFEKISISNGLILYIRYIICTIKNVYINRNQTINEIRRIRPLPRQIRRFSRTNIASPRNPPWRKAKILRWIWLLTLLRLNGFKCFIK